MTAALTPEQAYLATVAELNTLAERSKHVTHVDVLRIASMSADELRRRAIVALDWHSCFSHCLDGMPELKAIPGGAPDGCWLPGPVRGVVEALLRRSDLTYEDTSHGRRKSPSPEAQRIEALEAELAALRASTYDKETINILVHTITRNDEAEDSIEDLKNAADMLKGKSILDALNAEYDNAAELAACKRNAERWSFSVTIGENQSMNWLDVYDDWDGEGDFTAAIDAAMAAGEKAS